MDWAEVKAVAESTPPENRLVKARGAGSEPVRVGLVRRYKLVPVV